MKQEIKDMWAGESCSINYHKHTVPAIISGRLEQFAQIKSLDGVFSIEYSWETVDRVMRNDGVFKV